MCISCWDSWCGKHVPESIDVESDAVIRTEDGKITLVHGPDCPRTVSVCCVSPCTVLLVYYGYTSGDCTSNTGS